MNTNGILPNPAFGKIFNRSISDNVGIDVTNQSPSVNIIETAESFDIEVAAPGLKKEDLAVSIEKDHLVISADNSIDEKENTPIYKRREYDFNKFSRKFRLPKTVETNSLKAKYDLGILTITVDKTPEAKEKGPRIINID